METRDLSPGDKHVIVQVLWNSVNDGGAALHRVPKAIRTILETEAWRDRLIDGRPYHNDTFLQFITTKPLQGCGWPVEKVKALLKDDPEVEEMFNKATTAPKHVHRVKDDTDIVSIKPVHGNGRAYTLSRLKRERPDLFERVVAGALSANAAAIEAGFRKKQTPLDALRAAWRKASSKDREAFRREIDAA